MATAAKSRRWMTCALGAAVLLGLLAAGLPDRAAADARRAPEIDVVGSGTLAWHRVIVRAGPSEETAKVRILTQFRADYRPQVVLALSERRGKEGEPEWYRVLLPGRPNGRKGWVRAAALDLHPVHKRLVIHRGTRRFEFWDGQRLVRAGKVAVGKAGAETPLGLFYVTWKFDPDIDPDWAILGSYAFETSAYSKLTDWPGGGIVGVHGTPWPELLGQAVSHGCVRMANGNIEFLRSRVPVGTPILIVRS